MNSAARPSFLPQYAANAVLDLERLLKMPADRFRFNGSTHDMERFRAYLRAVIALLRHGVHIVMPANGEIYRSNDINRTMPTPDECESFVGLPAPVTCFEYPWTHSLDDMDGSQIAAPRRITIVGDSKQVYAQGDPPPGFSHSATMVSVVYDEVSRMWAPLDTTLTVMSPLVVAEPRVFPKSWGIRAKITNEVTGETITDPHSRLIGEWCADVVVAVQCCHALRAGATLEERSETLASRRWKFDKKGVGGFIYHVLTLPRSGSRSNETAAGSHASPRLHVRRAHIRKLPSGALTFVRQCMVGDPEKGLVEKHYVMRGAKQCAA